MDGTSTARDRGTVREVLGLAGSRWRWTVVAALAGAAAGAAVAWGVRRVHTEDAPEALEPEQLVAVVDRPDEPSA